MTISTELTYAILSLDSYNRGYDQGVLGLGGIDSSIGGYTILMESNTDPQSPEVAASFYADAYQDASGNIVISYRGTDDEASDLVNCWGGGLGGYQTAQAKLAVEFYTQVKLNNPNATITLTGHSLGGGLAGLVARLTGCQASKRRVRIYRAPLH
jgi:Lipase (class 3)